LSTAQQTVLYEDAMKLDFLEEVYKTPGGEKIKHCIQCGTCSGSCPVSWAMEQSPRQIFAMIRAGMRDKVLDSLTIWTCASCYQCASRCPQKIKITDVMYTLKRIAMRENRKRSKNVRLFSEKFFNLVNKQGRNSETALMMGYMLATNPFGSIGYAPIGLKLFTRGRMTFGKDRIKGIDGLRRLIAKAQQLGGEV
jgi:quinone-modifying oxidoreductase, subunit QmoC